MMTQSASPEYRRLAFDCTNRSAADLLSEIGRSLGSQGPDVFHAALVLEKLEKLDGSVVYFLGELARRVLRSSVRACVVDASGFVTTFLDQWADALPIAAYENESPLARRKRVLIVEDNEESLDFLQMLIDSGGHRSVVARQASEAYQRLDEESFDLLLLDLLLPDTDGMAVARHVRDRGLGVPIIAISGHLDRWSEEEFARTGIRRRLNKPVRAREILDAVHHP
jgi:CheY-like chemotaxis protein